MSIAIYTYRDPYLFEQEPFWNEIKSCPYFCASQTLVNGMKAVYLEDFQQGRVTTVQNLIDAAYHDWIDTPRAIRQYAVIDNVIADLLGSFEGDLAKENVLRALQFNRGEVFITPANKHCHRGHWYHQVLDKVRESGDQSMTGRASGFVTVMS